MEGMYIRNYKRRDSMNMTENANFIQFLQAIGWSDAQITNFMLAVEGRISIEEAKEKHEKENQASSQ